MRGSIKTLTHAVSLNVHLFVNVDVRVLNKCEGKGKDVLVHALQQLCVVPMSHPLMTHLRISA